MQVQDFVHFGGDLQRPMMRGHWNHAAPVAITSGQHLQQQHQSMAEEQQQPLLSAATPAWGLVDSVVSMEPAVEKLDSGGFSATRFTSESPSPRSRGCSETLREFCHSPGSSSFQESSQMHYPPSLDYSAQAIIKTMPTGKYNGEMQREMREPSSEHEIMSELEMNETSSEVEVEVQRQGENSSDVPANEVSSTVKPVKKPCRKNMACPICFHKEDNRDVFLEHLKTHCIFIQQGTSEDFNPEEECSDEENDQSDDPSNRTPHIRPDGKVKTFQCKKCRNITLTKYDSWIHQREHIKPEKLLFCKLCPFSTEYKHHLEYHISKHNGTKPWKCPRCPYTCVNKSMLNSHLKSHSSIYQYRCMSCGYATKYCHSLKLHLRKYLHKPATVLNPDGTPNPVNPVIDVYGTRRGPRIKTVSESTVGSSRSVQSENTASPSVQIPVPSTSGKGINGQRSAIQDTVHSKNVNPVPGPSFLQRPCPLYQSLFGSQHMFPAHPTYSAEEAAQMEILKNDPAFLEYLRQVQQFQVNEGTTQQLPQEPLPQSNVTSDSNAITVKLENEDVEEQQSDATSKHENLVKALKAGTTPLDLSKPEVSPSSSEIPSSQAQNNKRRRKGKAVKLDQRVLQADSDCEEEEEQPKKKLFNDETNLLVPRKNACHENVDFVEPKSRKDPEKRNVRPDGWYSCDFCDMLFKNEIMYTVHAGYHGRENPLQCNSCGHESADPVAFFVHIGRMKH